jgi:outer membrane protein TolC
VTVTPNALRRAAAALALALASPALAAPITLDEALAIAAEENPDLALARADADAARADRTTSVSNVLPRLDLVTSLGRDFTGPRDNPTTVVDPQTGERFDLGFTPRTNTASYALSLQLTQPLLDLASYRDVSRAGATARAAILQHDEAELTVAFDVTRRFYEVVRAERSLAVLESTVARSEELVSRAEALFAAGRAPKSEIYTARVNLGNDRIAVERQRAAVAQARSSLAQALGRPAGEALEVVAPRALDGAAAAGAEPPPPERLLALALERRPALAAERARIDAADAAVGAARAGYLPTLDLRMSYGRQGADLYGREAVFGQPNLAYGADAQIVLSWNVFEGRRTAAAVSRARATAERARAGSDKLVEAVAKELADARAVAVSTSRLVALSTENLRTAEEGLTLARERLEAGLASQIEIRDASLKLTQAELSLVEARIDYAVARADLARAAGGPI